jgi:hypothetical protein
VVEQAVQLTPDALVKLVPQLVPAKPRARRRAAKR